MEAPTSPRPYLTAHGLTGCFAELATDHGDRVVRSGIITSGTLESASCPAGSVSSTDYVCSFSDNAVAAVAGIPRWQDAALAATAASRGHANALVEGYQRHGRAVLESMRGAFSFIIIDGGRDTVLAAIDRLGLHTLYFRKRDDSLYLGSTASSVLPPGVDRDLCDQAIYNYFYFHMVPSPISVYCGVEKLPAAHCLELKGGELQLSRYWAPEFRQKPRESFDKMGEVLKQQLRGAVERSLDGSGSVGTFLSGGLDSSTVTGMLAEHTGGSCPAYAIGFDEPGYDEMEFARNTARHFGVELREYYVTPEDVLRELPRIATSYDEPFGNSSALPAYFCALRAREDNVDCLLAGDGGDEIFAGNERYAKQQVFELYSRIPTALRGALIEPLVSALPGQLPLAGKAKSYIRQAHGSPPRPPAELQFPQSPVSHRDVQPRNCSTRWTHTSP